MKAYHLLQRVVRAAVIDHQELPRVIGILFDNLTHTLLHQCKRCFLVIRRQQYRDFLFHLIHVVMGAKIVNKPHITQISQKKLCNLRLIL